MSKSETPSSATFLAAVQQQLRALELADQREILDELAAHLQDAVTMRETAGNSTAEAEVAAVRAMGEPATIGQRLRDEHLSKRLSLSRALLTALPLAIIAFVFDKTELRFMIREFGTQNSGFPASFLAALAPIVAVGLWLLARTRQSWPATLVGGVGVLGLLGVTHADGIVSHWPIGMALVALALLAIIPLTLGFALRWGSFRATLAILAGVGVYGCYAWLGEGQLAPTLAIGLCPILGVIALGLTPRRWRMQAAWAVFGVNWLGIMLDAFYYQHLYRVQYLLQLKAQPGYSPSATYHIPSLHVIDMVSPAFLVGSAVLLLSVQAVTRLQANGRIALPLRWAR